MIYKNISPIMWNKIKFLYFLSMFIYRIHNLLQKARNMQIPHSRMKSV